MDYPALAALTTSVVKARACAPPFNESPENAVDPRDSQGRYRGAENHRTLAVNPTRPSTDFH